MSDDEDEEEDKAKTSKKGNKFFEAEESKRKERERLQEDKHLLGEDRFLKGGKKVGLIVLPFSTIDIVFNHKNIWANL